MYNTDTKFAPDDSLFEYSKQGKSSQQNENFVSTFHTSAMPPGHNSSLFSEKKYTSQDYNPNFGFNSTSTRFGYKQVEIQRLSKPGPGFYEAGQQMTIAANT